MINLFSILLLPCCFIPCSFFYGIFRLSHLITEHGAGFDFNLFISKPNNMNSNLILKSDILDIIFEKRNKNYGAYNLRKYYPSRLKTALSFMGLIVLVFSAFILLHKKTTRLTAVPYVFNEPELTNVAEKPKAPEKPREAVKKEASVTPVSQRKFISNPVIVNDRWKTDTIHTLREKDAIGSENIVNNNSRPVTLQPQKTESGSPATEASPKIDKTVPVELGTVDVPPVFPGGMEALRNFLKKHLNAPDPVNEGETVSVKVRFVVGYDGKLHGFKIVEDGGESFNREVMRVLKKMPDWVPGKAKGENVAVYYIIPVKFTGAD